MKPEYLGDCLDFYRRWFLEEFFTGEQLAAIPMLTAEWPQERAFALAHLPQDRVLINGP